MPPGLPALPRYRSFCCCPGICRKSEIASFALRCSRKNPRLRRQRAQHLPSGSPAFRDRIRTKPHWGDARSGNACCENCRMPSRSLPPVQSTLSDRLRALGHRIPIFCKIVREMAGAKIRRRVLCTTPGTPDGRARCCCRILTELLRLRDTSVGLCTPGAIGRSGLI